jgi:hypothetical protein
VLRQQQQQQRGLCAAAQEEQEEQESDCTSIGHLFFVRKGDYHGSRLRDTRAEVSLRHSTTVDTHARCHARLRQRKFSKCRGPLGINTNVLAQEGHGTKQGTP